jgi:cytochrome oxidase Cu insertion factor (SCO1/SenC/PrrC family)
MPGMGKTSFNTGVVVSAFHSALLHQILVLVAIFGVVVVAWAVVRWRAPRLAAGAGAGPAEPSARRILRIGFGVLWLFDGFLQAQSAMPGGLAGSVVAPTETGSPGWVRHLVAFGVRAWQDHPVPMAAAAVWIQVGLGVWLLVAPSGRISRLGGAAGAVWGLVVWVFGEAFGQIFAPGATWLFGAPGAVALYVVAGALIAAPPGLWRPAPRLLLGGAGLFYAGMALLQAWPGRGFWQGGKDNPVAAMAGSMSQLTQPHVMSRLIVGFGGLAQGHGFALNLVVVLALAVIGVALSAAAMAGTGDRAAAVWAWVVRPAVLAAFVVGLATWVVVQDLGFLGGLGTDPNSMIPLLLLVVAGARGLRPRAAAAAEPVGGSEPEEQPASVGTRSWAEWKLPVAAAAVAVILVGAVPMAVASANGHADALVAQELDGSPQVTDSPAPPFRLTDQSGRPASLAQLRGRVVLMTFLDPVCTSDCPLIAQEFRAAARRLNAARVELVAIVANPVYRSVGVIQAFDTQEGLDTVRNWLFLTGSPSQLAGVWNSYGVQVAVLPAGAMVAHSDLAYVIDPAGRLRYELNFDPGPGTAVTQGSFTDELVSEATGLESRS